MKDRSIWRKKRIKYGLTISEVANYLDIDYQRYELIDKGVVKMPRKYIDKFNELINKNKKEKNIDRLNREEIVNKWWDEVSVKTGYGKYKLNEKMKEFNIDSLNELAHLLGWSTQAGLCNYLNGNSQIGFDVKNKLYSFFENELNIQPPKEKIKKERSKKLNNGEKKPRGFYARKISNEFCDELYNWYNNFNIREWAEKNNLTRHDIKNGTCLGDGTVSNLYRKTFDKPAISTVIKLKNYVDKVESDNQNVMTETMVFESVPVEDVPEDIKEIGQKLVEEVNRDMQLKEKLSMKYRGVINEIEEKIEKHQEIIAELNKEKEIYEKIINDLYEEE